MTDGRLLEFREAGMRFGAVKALAGLSFSQAPGTLLCLLGPSGCGKTTLLRLAGGLLEPTSGEVLLEGGPARQRWDRVAYVFQEPRLAPWRTAVENVELALELRRPAMSPRWRRRMALAQLERVELGAEAGRYPAQLSGGQAQRVALARALAVEPQVLLMDEPFGALDAGTRGRLRRMLLELHVTTAGTILFVTHDVEEALLLGDEVLLLSPQPGRVLRRYRLGQRPRDGLDEAGQALEAEILDRFMQPAPA